MRIRFAGLLGMAVALTACHGEKPVHQGCNANDNPIDSSICPEFQAAAFSPVQASDTEICTRLSVDVIGMRPSHEWIATRCAGREITDVVRSLQGSVEYRETQRRRWADRLQYNDMIGDVKSIHDLDALVDRLYQGDVSYGEFGEIALAHPGFVGRFIGYGQPEQVADAAFHSFLGRAATNPERTDVANLWRPWIGSQVIVEAPAGNAAASAATGACPNTGGVSDGCGFYGNASEPVVDPTACQAGVKSCESNLLGHAVVAFPTGSRTQPILPEQLTAADWYALRAPGRLFAAQPMFWENEVDDVLKKYLGYDFGTRRPEAREKLVRWFQATGGDVPLLERAVLTSWAYRLPAVEDPAHPVPSSLTFEPIAYGPTKLMIPETWLTSISRVADRPAGDMDWRYPNLPDWYTPGYGGTPALEQLLSDVKYPKNADGSLDATFRNRASAMGGAPGMFDYGSFTSTVRVNQMGLLTAVAQEESTTQICYAPRPRGLLHPQTAATQSEIRALVKSTIESIQGRTPGADEAAAMAGEISHNCSGCTLDEISRDLCAGLTGGVEFIFY